MISGSDVLQIISEIHQFSMLLIELKEDGTVGIVRSTTDTMTCFKIEGSPKRTDRGVLVKKFYEGEFPDTVKAMTVDELLTEVEGKKARHIWLESGGKERREHGFLSISELKSFFRIHPHR